MLQIATPEPADLEQIATDIRVAARTDGVKAGGLEIAAMLGIPVVFTRPPDVHGEGEIEPYRGDFRILLLTGLSPQESSFAAAHEISHVWFRRTGAAFLTQDDEEDAADQVAAALLMPAALLLRSFILHDPDFPALALEYGVSQTAMALRFGELTGQPVAIVGASRPLFRGQPPVAPGPVSCLRLVRLTDADLRFALLG